MKKIKVKRDLDNGLIADEVKKVFLPVETNSHLGVPKGEVRIVDYDPRWSQDFDTEKEALLKLMGEDITAIEHVGSTAAPGLCAKPVIDISATVQSLEPVDAYVEKLRILGYRHVPERSYPEEGYQGRHLFVKDNQLGGTHQLKLVKEGDEKDWHKLIAFRDHLRSNPKDREQYGTIKRKIASADNIDRETYTKEKSHFIQKVMSNLGKV